MASDDQVVGFGFGDTGGDRADAHFGDQFDADRGLGVSALEVVNQLCKILNRVDVVVRRWRYQPDPRHRMTQKADVLRDFVARQLPAFTWFCALRHLDLDLVGIDQVLIGDAKATGGDLFYRRAQAVALF